MQNSTFHFSVKLTLRRDGELDLIMIQLEAGTWLAKYRPVLRLRLRLANLNLASLVLVPAGRGPGARESSLPVSHGSFRLGLGPGPDNLKYNAAAARELVILVKLEKESLLTKKAVIIRYSD